MIYTCIMLPSVCNGMILSLTDGGAGSWDEGMSTEATGMFFRALRNLSER